MGQQLLYIQWTIKPSLNLKYTLIQEVFPFLNKIITGRKIWGDREVSIQIKAPKTTENPFYELKWGHLEPAKLTLKVLPYFLKNKLQIVLTWDFQMRYLHPCS